MNQDKKIFFYLLMNTLTFLCIAIIFYGWNMYKNSAIYKTNQIIKEPIQVGVIPLQQNLLFIHDPYLGFVTNHGKYKIILSKKSTDQKLITTVNINKKGYRFPYDDIKNYNDHLWFFGCSYTWGWGLNDNEIFTDVMQQKIKSYKIHNYSIPAYGNIHYLLQLKQLLKTEAKPKAAVFMYNFFHPQRNVAAPSRLRNINTLGKDLYHPAGYLENEELKIKTIPISDNQGKDPSRKYMLEVTKKIFIELLNICKANDIIPIVCLQDTEPDDSMAAFLINKGFTVFDLNIDLSKPGMRNYPLDAHPSFRAHKKYADKLIKNLQNTNII